MMIIRLAMVLSLLLAVPAYAATPAQMMAVLGVGTTTECVGLVSSGCTPGTTTASGPIGDAAVAVNKFDPAVDATVINISCKLFTLGDLGGSLPAKAVVYNGTTQICEAPITLVADTWVPSSDFAGCTFLSTDSDIRYGCTVNDTAGGTVPSYTFSNVSTPYYSQTAYDPDPAVWTTNTGYITAAILKYEY